jgi:hypothetical protein
MRRIACVLLVFGMAVSLACSSDAVGVDGCRKIEEARCNRGAECGVDLNVPVHQDTSPEGNKQACIRFYRDACLHGMPVDPGAKETDACVVAIASGDCSTVLNPEAAPACKFLNATDAAAPAPAEAAPPADAATGG